MPSGPELALTLLAVTDCATCVPLDPTLDEAHCRLVLSSVRVGALIVAERGADAVFLGHPEVLEAASFAVHHPTLGEDVAVAVVLRQPSTVKPQELRDFAFAALAAFKVPTRVAVVTSLPKTALGKVRRRELADLLAEFMRPQYAPPNGVREELVTQIFSGVLGVDRVGVHDNFFDLGGDSLRGAQVIARVNSALDLDVGLAFLFRRPTVAEFAAGLAGAASAASRYGPPPIDTRATRITR